MGAAGLVPMAAETDQAGQREVPEDIDGFMACLFVGGGFWPFW